MFYYCPEYKVLNVMTEVEHNEHWKFMGLLYWQDILFSYKILAQVLLAPNKEAVSIIFVSVYGVTGSGIEHLTSYKKSTLGPR